MAELELKPRQAPEFKLLATGEKETALFLLVPIPRRAVDFLDLIRKADFVFPWLTFDFHWFCFYFWHSQRRCLEWKNVCLLIFFLLGQSWGQSRISVDDVIADNCALPSRFVASTPGTQLQQRKWRAGGFPSSCHNPGEEFCTFGWGEVQTEGKEFKTAGRKDWGPNPINQTRKKMDWQVPNKTKQTHALHSRAGALQIEAHLRFSNYKLRLVRATASL